MCPFLESVESKYCGTLDGKSIKNQYINPKVNSSLLLEIESRFTPYKLGRSSNSKVACNYQVQYPSTAGYGDSIKIQFSKLSNAVVYIAIGTKEDGMGGLDPKL